MLRKTEPLSSLAAPIITLIPLIPATFIQKKNNIYICIYIYMNPEKTYLQSLYKYTHPIFYGTRFATEERGSRLWHVYTSSAILLMEAYVNQSLVFCYRAQRLVIWLLQWLTALSFGSDDVGSTQPRRYFYLGLFFFFKYMYLQCGWTAVAYQLLHIKKENGVKHY